MSSQQLISWGILDALTSAQIRSASLTSFMRIHKFPLSYLSNLALQSGDPQNGILDLNILTPNEILINLRVETEVANLLISWLPDILAPKPDIPDAPVCTVSLIVQSNDLSNVVKIPHLQSLSIATDRRQPRIPSETVPWLQYFKDVSQSTNLTTLKLANYHRTNVVPSVLDTDDEADDISTEPFVVQNAPMLAELSTMLQSLPNLTSLDLYNLQTTELVLPEQLVHLCLANTELAQPGSYKSLIHCTRLESLDLVAEQYEVGFLEYLFSVLPTSLTQLTISLDFLDYDIIDHCLSTLVHHTRLESIHIHGTLTNLDYGWPGLVSVLPYWPHLKSLEFRGIWTIPMLLNVARHFAEHPQPHPLPSFPVFSLDQELNEATLPPVIHLLQSMTELTTFDTHMSHPELILTLSAMPHLTHLTLNCQSPLPEISLRFHHLRYFRYKSTSSLPLNMAETLLGWLSESTQLTTLNLSSFHNEALPFVFPELETWLLNSHFALDTIDLDLRDDYPVETTATLIRKFFERTRFSSLRYAYINGGDTKQMQLDLHDIGGHLHHSLGNSYSANRIRSRTLESYAGFVNARYLRQLHPPDHTDLDYCPPSQQSPSTLSDMYANLNSAEF